MQKEWMQRNEVKEGKTVYGTNKKPKSKTQKVRVGSKVWERD